VCEQYRQLISGTVCADGQQTCPLTDADMQKIFNLWTDSGSISHKKLWTHRWLIRILFY